MPGLLLAIALVVVEDLVAESSGSPESISIAPTVAQYVETVTASFSKGTADTYKSYWRLAVTRFGGRPIDAIGVDDCESVVVDAPPGDGDPLRTIIRRAG